MVFQLLFSISCKIEVLADFLKIEFDDILTIPTFNRFPMVANTSFRPEKAGSIASSTLSRHKTLTHEELDIIDKMTRVNYQKVLNKAVRTG